MAALHLNAGVIYGGEKMCRAEILSNDPNPHTIVCSTYYPYWEKTYYPDYIVIHLNEPVKMDIKVKAKVTLKFADGREIVIKTGDE
jgi:hypothetical protein